MSSDDKKQSLSTDAKLLINQWHSLHDIMQQITAVVKDEQAQHNEKSPPLLNDQQMQDALGGPYRPFIIRQLHAYAKVAQWRLYLVAANDETFKIHHREQALPEKKLAKMSSGDLDKVEKKLNELSKDHFQQWQEKLNEWHQQILLNLTAQGFTLSDIEIKEIKDQEPRTQLLGRFTDLQITPPKYKQLNFAEYLRLKTYLCVHSALSRQHQAHEENNINPVLKKLKHDLNDFDKQEQALHKAQQTAVEESLQGLA